MAYEGYWGEVTSTIDWCEENYILSPYLAEFFNTTTNLAFIFLSLFGIYNIKKNGSNQSFILAYLGVILVGFGSWCFHMTLHYEMQLLDELPMIYVASLVLWLTYLADPNQKVTAKIPIALISYSLFVTFAYIKINLPVFHEVSYALIVFVVVFKSIKLLKKVTLPYERKQLNLILILAALGFLLSFFIWNLDNQFCDHLRNWRHSVPLWLGAWSELHGWWHIGTALGVYYYIVFCEWVVPVLSNSHKKFKLYWFGPICFIREIEKKY